jgi:predicted aspartyl protease
MAVQQRSIATLGAIIIFALSAQESDGTELRVSSNRLFLSVTINGQVEQALLDSAAEMTLVDDDLARTLNLPLKETASLKGSGGESSVRFADRVTIRAAGTTLNNLTVGVLDLKDVSSRLVGTPVSIILGREFFDAARLRIDIEGGTLQTLKRTSIPVGTEYKLTSSQGIESIPAQVNGIPVQADFDLGNGSEVLIGRKFAELHGLAAVDRVVEHKVGGGLGGSVQRDIIILSKLELAGHIFRDVRAAIDDQSSAGDLNIGTSVLRSFIVVTDFAEHRVWLVSRER